MSLFQKSVVNKYLKNLNQQTVEEAYKQFQQFYDDAERIENIRLLKEENYQEGFLREIFVDVLGYTINPNKNYNLTTEYKNETDSKKADGAILLDENAIGVIELKSTKTPDLESIRDQAFNYKNNQTNCRYVITSNFEKLRFYIDNATDWEEFNLFHLDYNNFCKLYLYLSKESIFNGITAKLKDESKLHEEDITGKLYKDYSVFKHQLFADLIKNNPSTDKLLLFHKSQKLLDRILFVLFAEDRGLLPPNAITRIIEQWEKLKELDEEKSLYSRFVKLFHHLDEGHKYKDYELPAYNGGLFKKDDVLDGLIISDSILNGNTIKLSSYDYNTEVDVNVLGHIFENSITEIEQVKAEIEGTQSDKNRSRRKKEGIFYTPKYITKYIVDNTVGALCSEKKKELGIIEIENEIIENSRTSKGKLTKKAETLLQKLNHYRDYLTSLKILDPACGSGAFLNQALEFLINEHELIDSYRRELEQDSLGLYDITKSILENNLYGVDINEEAVEIAKLSLWIRTAERGRKLSDLSKNIKCGNSLIDDPTVAGDKAFNWNKEFPEIMDSGGFDVVIGNPPYVSNWTQSDDNRNQVLYLDNKFKDYLTGHWDLFNCFIAQALFLLKSEGYHSFILPTSFLKEKYSSKIRESFVHNYLLKTIVDFGLKNIFDNVARQTTIYIIKNASPTGSDTIIRSDTEKIISAFPQSFFALLKNYSFKTNVTDLDVNLFSKINLGSKLLGSFVCINLGVVAHSRVGSPIAFKKDDVIHKVYLSGYKKFIQGENVGRYSVFHDNDFLDYDSKASLFHRPKFKLLFENPKIIIRRVSGPNNSILAVYDELGYYSNDNLIFMLLWSQEVLNYQKPEKKWDIIIDKNLDLRYINAILCSKLATYYFSKFLSTDTLQGSYSGIYPEDLRQIPFKLDLTLKQDIISYVQFLLNSNNRLNLSTNSFISRINSNFVIKRLSNKLKEFYNYDFKTFLSELKKKKITLTLKQQDEWEQYFNEYKTEINKLQQQINQTDKEIDQLVYKLYGLTEEEIKIVEESTKK